MAINAFIPSIWNAELLLGFKEQAVAAGLVNRQYEGDATKGNTVKVTTAVDVGVKDYKAAGRTTTADGVDASAVDLTIDQEKSFDFYVDDIDRAQAAGSMSAYTTSASEGLAQDADAFILATAVGGADAGNVTAAGTAMVDGDDAWNVLRDLRKTLNKNHVPQGNRIAIINAEFEAVLLDASSKLTSVDTSGSPQALRDAILGRILGFTVVTSENLPTTAKASVLAYYRPAVAFASQIQETEALRATDKFADRLRGLHVYGGKVIRPKAVAVWTSA